MKLRKSVLLLLLFIISTNQFLIALSKELRAYDWVLAFLGLSTYFVVSALESGRRRDLLGWAVSSALTFSFHYTSALPLAVQSLFLLYRWCTRKRKAGDLLIAVGVGSTLALPSLLILLNRDKWLHFHSLDYTFFFSLGTFRSLLNQAFIPSLLFSKATLPWIEEAFVYALIWFSSVAKKPSNDGFQLCSLMSAIPLILLIALGMTGLRFYLPRHFIYIELYLILSTSLLLAEAFGSERKFLKISAILLALLFCFNGLIATRQSASQAISLVRNDVFHQLQPSTHRLTRLEGILPDGVFRRALCEGRVVFSDDYLAVWSLFFLCPQVFSNLERINSQLFLPSSEWRNLQKSPLVLAYSADVPSKRLHGTPQNFFERYSQSPTSDFDRIEGTGIWIPPHTLWVKKSALVELNQNQSSRVAAHAFH